MGHGRRLRHDAAAAVSADRLVRCAWAPVDDAEYLAYHDEEWGVPIRDERRLFEMLTLEGAQAGLSWSTILHKREGYRRAFASFDPETVPAFTERDVERLLGDASIVRNRLKVRSTVDNARAVVALRGETTLDEVVWSFVDGQAIDGRHNRVSDIPAETPESRAMSKELKRGGSASSARPSATRSCRGAGW